MGLFFFQTSIAVKPWSNTVQWLCMKMGPTTIPISHFSLSFPSETTQKVESILSKILKDPRICSQHFGEQDLKKALGGKIEVISCSVPKIFNPTQLAAKNDPRKERKAKRDRGAEVEH